MENVLPLKNIQKYTRQYSYVMLPIAAIFLWLISLRNIDLRSMNDLGLISVLPPMVFVALSMLTTSFCLVLYQQRFREGTTLLHILILVFMLYGVAPLLEGMPRTPSAWKLLGIIDRVMDTGTVDPTRDAFQNWPGFFILAAFVTQVMGFSNPILLATWAPVFLNLLYFAPLYLIFRVGTSDKRLIWVSLWFFYLANWIGQDYLSPQGFNFFFFLVIMSILLQWFKYTPDQPILFIERWLQRPLQYKLVARVNLLLSLIKLRDQPSQPWQRVGLLAIIIILFCVIVPSHQLTPFATIAAVSALILFKRLTPRSLPVLMVVIAITWIIFMTVAYLRGHFETIASPLGSLGSNLNANLTNRFRGSAEHIFILELRLILSWVIWMLALIGIIRRLLKDQLELTFLILAGVPFILLAMQAYGGELLMRVYLFSLPFMAFFMAAVFYPDITAGRSGFNTAIFGLVSMVLIVSFFFTRYGNERMDYFTPQEVEAVQYLYGVAEPGAQILAGTQTLPWRFDEYDSYWYKGVERIVRTNDIDLLAETMADRKYSISYLILTRSQRASARLFLGWPPGTWERFENTLIDSGQFNIIFDNGDARIFVLNMESVK